jgi:excisionase family DNA binding protein
MTNHAATTDAFKANSAAMNRLAAYSEVLPDSEIYRSVLRDYPDVLNVGHVSAILGVSSKTVYRLLNEGLLPSLKVGRAFKIPKLYMLEYLKLIVRSERS